MKEHTSGGGDNCHKQKTTEQTATGIIEIGKRLIEAKSQLEHGQWGKWLEDKIDFSHDTARNFIRIAEEFGNDEPIRNLSYKKLFLLTSLPSDQRDEFIESNDVEEMTTRQLQEENRKDFSFSEKMKWAEELKNEYGKIARENQESTQFGNTDCQNLGTPIGRVSDKVAQDLDIGSGEQFRKAEYIHKNADEEMIKKLDDGQLSINAAYIELKNKINELPIW